MKAREQMQQSLSVSNRRLDELAWLLEGSSMCTAVAVVDGKFYISANEFSKRTQAREKNKKLDLICEVMEYFRSIARGELTGGKKESLRDALMKKIIKQQISTSTLGRISIPEEIFNEIITSKVLHGEKLPREFKEKDIAYIALGYGLMANKRIRKIEDSIEDALKGKFGEINQGQLSAFRNFRHDDKDRKNSNILFFETKTGVHAELQVLSQIVDMADVGLHGGSAQEFYLGISKRCCFDCEHMLQSANEILGSRGIVVGYEGTHGAEFSENWVCPSAFVSMREDSSKETKKTKSAAAASSSTQEKQVFEQIYEVYKQRIEAELGSAANSYTQRHSISSSDYSSHPEERIAIYKERLEEDLATVRRLEMSNTNIEGMLGLGLDLCEILEFQQLFEEEIISGIKARGEAQGRVGIILARLNKIRSQSGHTVEEKSLVEFLSNKKFTPEKIAECFASLSLGASHGTQYSVPALKG